MKREHFILKWVTQEMWVKVGLVCYFGISSFIFHMVQNDYAKSAPTLSVNSNKDQKLGPPRQPLVHSAAFYCAVWLGQCALVILAIRLWQVICCFWIFEILFKYMIQLWMQMCSMFLIFSSGKETILLGWWGNLNPQFDGDEMKLDFIICTYLIYTVDT